MGGSGLSARCVKGGGGRGRDVGGWGVREGRGGSHCCHNLIYRGISAAPTRRHISHVWQCCFEGRGEGRGEGVTQVLGVGRGCLGVGRGCFGGGKGLCEGGKGLSEGRKRLSEG